MFPNAAMEIGQQPVWLMPLAFALFGACIGSFLNVVIYRLPRGMRVDEPRRSFCPTCHQAIPWYLNIPLLSWLMLRGRSACCHQRIPIRYWLVELATALLFAAIAWHFDTETILTQILLCLWSALMLAILCIDWEQMIVLARLTVMAALAGLLAAVLSPWLLMSVSYDATDGAMRSMAGALGGFLLFRLIGLLGRLFFGHRRESFPTPCIWELHQAADGEDIELVLNGKSRLWSELFLEQSNRVTLSGATLEGHLDAPGSLFFSPEGVELPDGRRLELADYESLRGTCTGLATRQEAMGSGDAWIALAIGSLCGWQGVVFSLVAGSFIGLLWALAARIRRGHPMPFGPCLILGALIWLFQGLPLLEAYESWCDSFSGLP